MGEEYEIVVCACDKGLACIEIDHQKYRADDRFDIDREIYTKWNNELERMHTQFMICGQL